jgi:hypothetical protein
MHSMGLYFNTTGKGSGITLSKGREFNKRGELWYHNLGGLTFQYDRRGNGTIFSEVKFTSSG